MANLILVVEDEYLQAQDYWKEFQATEPSFGVKITDHCTYAENFFRQNEGSIAGIIVDGAVPLLSGGGLESRLTTIPFIQVVASSNFRGPIIAASGSKKYRATMLEYGCTEEAEKRNAVKTILARLKDR